MLYSFIVYRYLPNIKKIYHYLFFVTQFAVIGMLFSFPFQGYAAFSIVFSSLHIFASYFFVKLILKDLKPFNTIDIQFIRAALWFMVISTIGIWCLPISIVIFGKNSDAYNIAIQTFLHFQFNGWFLFAIIGLGIGYFLPKKENKQRHLNQAFKWLTLSVCFTLALPISWYFPHPILNVLNTMGIVFQLAGIIYLIVAVKNDLTTFLVDKLAIIRMLFWFVLFSLLVKIVFQSFSIIPEINEASLQIRNLVIGFIHLLMLGVISGALLLYLMLDKIIANSSFLITVGCILFMIGFILSEVYLFIQGNMYYLRLGKIPAYHISLFVWSAFIVLGIMLFLINVIATNKKSD